MAQTGGLKHISPLLQVRDLELSIEFYVQRLGFRLEFQDRGFVGVFRDDCGIFLAQKENRDVDLRNVAAKTVDDGWANYDLHIHCAYGTVDDLWREFRDAGVPMREYLASGPVDRPYGIRDFSVFDPDGYHVVFGAPIDPEPDPTCP